MRENPLVIGLELLTELKVELLRLLGLDVVPADVQTFDDALAGLLGNERTRNHQALHVAADLQSDRPLYFERGSEPPHFEAERRLMVLTAFSWLLHEYSSESNEMI